MLVVPLGHPLDWSCDPPEGGIRGDIKGSCFDVLQDDKVQESSRRTEKGGVAGWDIPMPTSGAELRAASGLQDDELRRSGPYLRSRWSCSGYGTRKGV